MSLMVYSGGSAQLTVPRAFVDANLITVGRAALHVAILVISAGFLLWVGATRKLITHYQVTRDKTGLIEEAFRPAFWLIAGVTGFIMAVWLWR